MKGSTGTSTNLVSSSGRTLHRTGPFGEFDKDFALLRAAKSKKTSKKKKKELLKKIFGKDCACGRKISNPHFKRCYTCYMQKKLATNQGEAKSSIRKAL